MKKIILLTALTSMLTFMGSVVLAQENQKKEVIEVPQEKNLARVDSAADYNKFIKVAEQGLNSNQATIVSLRATIDPNAEMENAFKQKLSDLEKENDVLKKRIAQSDRVATNAWTMFKHEFNTDMNELTKALRDI